MWYIHIILVKLNLSLKELKSNESVWLEVYYQGVLQNYLMMTGRTMSIYIYPFAPGTAPGGWQYRRTFEQQHLKNRNNKRYLYRTFYKEYPISFLMIYRLIGFGLVILQLLMFKFYGNFGIFHISGTENVKCFCRKTFHINFRKI